MDHHAAVDLQLIRDLQSKSAGPCLSMYVPTIKAGPDTDQNRIRFKNQIKRLAELLDTDTLQTLDDHWHALVATQNDQDLWQHTGDGMAWFVSPTQFHQVELPCEPVSKVAVAGRFFVRPLFAALESGQRFRLLALSINSVTLYQGDGTDLRELALDPRVPRSLSEALGEHDQDATRQAHVQGPAGAIYHDQDEGAHDKARVRRYLAALSKQLDAAGALDDDPVVLAGVDWVTQLFSKVAAPHWRVLGSISGNVEDRSLSHLHADAWTLVAAALRSARQRALAELRDNALPRLACDPVEVATAALEGRIDTVYYLTGIDVPGRVDAEACTVTRTAATDAAADSCDLIDETLSQTLAHGGAVVAVEQGELDAWDRAPMVAKLRY